MYQSRTDKEEMEWDVRRVLIGLDIGEREKR
jgi:hypothetical protein